MDAIPNKAVSKGKTFRFKKWARNFLIVLLAALAIFIYVHYFFVFGTSVKAGRLDSVVYKGFIFKTYEGKLIQDEFREFEFSIADKAIADSLMLCSGREVELRYKEYLSSVPWRGRSKYLIDKIIDVK